MQRKADEPTQPASGCSTPGESERGSTAATVSRLTAPGSAVLNCAMPAIFSESAPGRAKAAEASAAV